MAGKDLIKKGMEAPRFGYVDVPGDTPRDSFAMVVMGDCMDPELREKDIVIMAPCDSPKDGDIVTVVYKDGFFIKRYRLIEGEPHLVPDNPAYPTVKVETCHEIVGKLIALRRKCRKGGD